MYPVPVDQVAGKAVSVVWLLVSLLHAPLALSRKNGVPLVVPRIAIQYFVPELTLAGLTEIVFQAPAVGDVLLPCVSSAPGCPLLSA